MSSLTAAELASMRDHADNLLGDTCTIQTKAVTLDSTGNPTESYTNTYTSVACRLDAVSGRGERALWGRLAAVSDWILSIKYDQTISEADRVIYGGTTYFVTAVEDAHTWRTIRRAGLRRVT
jgi:SPP1 family predicted phage head-tail adaptor